jgi:hypothetical protein
MRGAKPKPEQVVAETWVPRGWPRLVLGVAAVAFLVMLAGITSIVRVPTTLPTYFLQMTALFPHATEYSFEYRVEGWRCDVNEFQELDYRRWFPLRPDDKENRFQRLGFFYVARPKREVLRALDQWLVDHHNRSADPGDGIQGKIGGIRLLSLRIPVPALGEHVERYRWKPLAEYPESVRKLWYFTPVPTRKERCR